MMSLYVLIALYYVFLTILELYTFNNLKKSSLIRITLLLFPLVVLVAFRNIDIGNDTYNYYRTYMNVRNQPLFSENTSRMEIGYVFLMRVFGKLGIGYLGFQVSITLFIYFVISSLIKNYSESYSFSCLILFSLFFSGTMNLQRQYLAVAILLLSLKYIINKKIIKFILLIIIASSIHNTAIIYILLYPVAMQKWTYQKILIMAIGSIFVGLSFDYIVDIFIRITGKYSGYLDSEYFIFENNVAIYIELLISLVFWLIGFFVKYYKKENFKVSSIGIYSNGLKSEIQIRKETLLFSAVSIGLIISIGGLNSTIMSRIRLYFDILYIIYIPDVLKKIKNKNTKTVFTFATIFLLIVRFFIILIYRPNWNRIVPYEFYK